MKKILFIIAGIFMAGVSYAQMDDKYYYPSKEWDGITGMEYSDIWQYDGGDTIHSVFIKPDGKAKATVLYFHGNGGNISKYIKNVRPLVDNGYQVVMTDYRGYGRSTGTPTHLSIAVDAQSLFDDIWKLEEVSGVPLIVYGASIGGHVATLITKNNNDKVCGLVLDGVAKSFTELALLFSPQEYHEVIKQYVSSPYSVENDIKSIKGVKVLFIHSEQDAIPISGAKEVFEGTTLPKEFWIYEGEHIMAAILYPDRFIGHMNSLIAD